MKIKLLAPHIDGGKQYAVNDEITADARLLDKLSRLGVGYEVVEAPAPKKEPERKADPYIDTVKPSVTVQSQSGKSTAGSFFSKKGNK